MPSKQYCVQLKSYVHGLWSVFSSAYRHEKHFKDELFKISLQISNNRWNFAINSDDRDH